MNSLKGLDLNSRNVFKMPLGSLLNPYYVQFPTHIIAIEVDGQKGLKGQRAMIASFPSHIYGFSLRGRR